jgi:hypothetical protein
LHGVQETARSTRASPIVGVRNIPVSPLSRNADANQGQVLQYVAQLGSASDLGSEGRRFKSRHTDIHGRKWSERIIRQVEVGLDTDAGEQIRFS